jgi:hypothetical protein
LGGQKTLLPVAELKPWIIILPGKGFVKPRAARTMLHVVVKAQWLHLVPHGTKEIFAKKLYHRKGAGFGI